jgi:hypothetical protein
MAAVRIDSVTTIRIDDTSSSVRVDEPLTATEKKPLAVSRQPSGRMDYIWKGRR